MQFIEFKTSSNWYSQALTLRNDVLRRPLGLDLLDEDLSQEDQYRHFGITHEEQLLAYVLILPESTESVTLRQMAVSPEYQKQGVGFSLLKQVESVLESDRVQMIQMAARVSAIPFYQKLGYECVGKQFLSVNIPHIRMEKRVSSSSEE